MNKITVVLLCVVVGFTGALFALPEGAFASMACSDGNCYYVTCSNNADCGANQFTGGPSCQANNQVYQNYITYTCHNGGTANSFCSTSITQKYQTSCSASQTCRYGLCMETGNPGYTGTTPPPLYGCYQYGCPFGQSCVNNVCQNTYTPPTYPQYPMYPTYPTYNAYTYKSCFNNKVYWYDTYGSQTYLYKNCNNTGQTCSNGACVGPVYQPTQPVQPTQPTQPAANNHAKTQCYQNDVYWYDSKGNLQDLFQSCNDNNQCTVDTCQDAQCVHTLQCDGVTCQNDSADYATYCGTVPDQNGTAAVSQNKFADFIKKWYPWIIIVAVLVVLFVVIFRKLSEKV